MFFTLHHYPSVSSTNDVLKKMIINGTATEGTVVTADKQTKGRGRGKHTWFSPQGSLALSICLTTCTAEMASHLQFVASLAVVTVIEALNKKNSKLQIRWPNDILISGKKIAGILVEQLSGAYTATIIGIGINIDTPDFPQEIKDTATSFALEGIPTTNKKTLATTVLSSFKTHYGVYQKKGFAPILKTWKRYWIDGDLTVTIINHWNEPRYSGTLQDIDADGFLIICSTAGDIVHLKGGDCHVLYPRDNA